MGIAEQTGRGLFVLARTSNPEGAGLQRAVNVDGRAVAQSILDAAAANNSAAVKIPRMPASPDGSPLPTPQPLRPALHAACQLAERGALQRCRGRVAPGARRPCPGCPSG